MTIALESVAKVLVINEKQEALILTTGTYESAPHKSFKPDFPGGLVDPGETELAASVRELNEETGIVVDANKFTLAFTETKFYKDENKSVSKFLYITRIDHAPNVILSWEHSRFEWVPISQLHTIELRPFYAEAIEYCFTSGILKLPLTS